MKLIEADFFLTLSLLKRKDHGLAKPARFFFVGYWLFAVCYLLLALNRDPKHFPRASDR
jgi:hypothetical protein